jgi:ABC-type glycerol-3-phosphate transport system substrate-binding protein
VINIIGIKNCIFSEHWGAEFRKGGKKMKKLIVLLFLGLMLAGCSDEFLAHDSLYKDVDHMTFSWWGYKNPTAEDAKMSNEQGWWGEEIPYIPAE